MDLERLSHLVNAMRDLYSELAFELDRLKKVGEAREDSLKRFEESVLEKLRQRERIIQSLKKEEDGSAGKIC